MTWCYNTIRTTWERKGYFMFRAIREARKTYKQSVSWYLRRSANIEENIHEAYSSLGDDHQGSLDWTPHEIAWKEKTLQELNGMAKVLGYTEEEITAIWSSVEKGLARKKSRRKSKAA